MHASPSNNGASILHHFDMGFYCAFFVFQEIADLAIAEPDQRGIPAVTCLIFERGEEERTQTARHHRQAENGGNGLLLLQSTGRE